MTIRSPFILALCVLLPALASATNVPLPDGMCALDVKVPEEQVIVDYMRNANIGYNQVLAIFAPCDDLDALKAKKTTGLSHYGSVLSQDLHQDIPMDRATYLTAVAAAFQQSGAQLTDAATKQSAAGIQTGTKAAGLENPQNVGPASKGIVYQDPRMVMIGMQQTNNFSSGATKVASLTSMTLVGKSPLSVNYYEPLGEDADFGKSKEILMRYTNQIIRANP